MEKKTRLLLCEDDQNLGSLLAQYLKAKDYEVELSKNGEDGWKNYRKGGFDLLLLDVMMPIKDGFTLARQIREKDMETPIIFLTAKNMKRDTLEGFESGADDYLTKPFSMEELLLRISAVLKRSRGVPTPEREVTAFPLGQLVFDARKQLIHRADGRPSAMDRTLTTKETDLLRLLCEQRNTILLRSKALVGVWGEDNYFNGRSMDVYIAKLRKYLADEPGVEIVNVHGKGFRLVAPEK